jgi:hypothetical protein
LLVRDDAQQTHHVIYEAIDTAVFDGAQVVGFAGWGS